MSVGEMWRRVVFFFRRERFDRELAEEMEHHLAMKERARARRGMPAVEARHAARREFGNALLLRERSRDAWGWGMVETLLQDLRYGVRMLRKSPGFTIVAVLTLALGIGANTAIFSAVNGILLRPLPYARPSRLVTIQRRQIAWRLTLAQVWEIRSACTTLARFERYGYGRAELSMRVGASERVRLNYVDGDFFPLLGVKPLLGRPILPQDMQPGSDRVAVLSYPLWMDEFGGDRGIVGRKIPVDGEPYTVIGVMPREFGLGIVYRAYDPPGTDDQAMWVPRTLSPANHSRSVAAGFMIGRLKDGATLAELNAQLKPLSDRFAAARFPAGIPAVHMGLRLYAQGLKPGILPDVQRGLLILFGAVGFVLLMACVSVASLLVARSWTRQREMAIRKALGATRLRMVRQLLTESLLLTVAGGALGLLVSVWGIHLLRAMAPPNTPRLEWVRLDAGVLGFTMGISFLAAVLVGVAPALQATSRRSEATLKGGLIGSFAGMGMRRMHRVQNALAVVEILLAVIVVSGGALMGRSFYKLMNLNTVPHPSRVLSMQIPSLLSARRIIDGVRSLGGVQEAALAASASPFGNGGMSIGHYPGSGRQGLYVDGLPGDRLPPHGWLDAVPVSPGYFATLGVRILRGRDFLWSDLGGPQVAIVSERFARTYFRGDPVGKHFSTEPDRRGVFGWVEIVGEVSNVRNRATQPNFVPPSFYVPLGMMGPGAELIVRTAANPMPLVPAIKRVIRSVDKGAQITHIETVNQMLAQSSIEPRFQTMLLGSFGSLGLLLAIVGVYGVISYSVVQRTHEIGVRMAMGAQRGNILRMILQEGMALAVSGIALGIAGALALTRFLRSMLFEIKPTDPATFIGVAMLLMIAALAACYIPARRAMKVDPMEALRYE